MFLYLPSLSTVVEVAALTAAYRQLRPDQKALETGHGQIWKKGEKVDNNFAIKKDRPSPTYSLHEPYQVIIPTGEGWGQGWTELPRTGQV